MNDFKVGYIKDGSEIIEIKDVDFGNKSAVKSAINDFAEKFAYADVEHALEITQSGKAFTLKGLSGNVNSEILGKDILRNAVSMHNHPAPKDEIMSDSFSSQDLEFVAEYKLGKQYLVSGERRNAFVYTGNLSREEMKLEYKKAREKLLEFAYEGIEDIECEKEQVLKILSAELEGFEFYGKF